MTKGTILVVEDHELMRLMYQDVLGALGFSVATAVDGRAGVARAAELLPDLILMDLRMPVLDGWGAKELLRADPATARIPIVAATSANFSAAESPEKRGFDGYLRKPFGPYELIRLLERFFPAPSGR